MYIYIYIWGTFLPAIFQSWDRVTTDTAKGCCERLRRHHQRQASPHCCTAGPLQFCQMCQGNPGKPMESTQKPWSFSTRNELGPTWPNYGGSFSELEGWTATVWPEGYQQELESSLVWASSWQIAEKKTGVQVVLPVIKHLRYVRLQHNAESSFFF